MMSVCGVGRGGRGGRVVAPLNAIGACDGRSAAVAAVSERSMVGKVH